MTGMEGMIELPSANADGNLHCGGAFILRGKQVLSKASANIVS